MQSADRGSTRSPWMADVEIAARPPLEHAGGADVCIIGAGIAGLTTAHLLARDGASVVVLDAATIAGGETARTSAHLASVMDRRVTAIERLHGRRGAELACASHAYAIDEIEGILDRAGIDAELRRVSGYLIGDDEASPAELDAELAAAVRCGCTRVRLMARSPLASWPGRAVEFPRQAIFHPLRYVRGLVEAIERDGGRIHCGTRVSAVDHDGKSLRIETAGGATLVAEHAVVATNSPFIDRVAIHTKQAAYRTYVIAAEIPRGAVPPGLYWDMADPYHYVRPAEIAGRSLLIVGGEDHKTGQEDPTGRFAPLEAWARRRFPQLGAVAFAWSGQVMETIDGLGMIGQNPGEKNVWIVTGDCGTGLTHGTLAGRLIRDGIAGVENPWAALYDPGRFRLAATGEWLRENVNVAAQLPKLLHPAEVGDVAEIAPGAGAIVRRGLSPIAAYRDAAGRLHERSAICPHLGCVVAWNALESSWDCPCHGSRFDADGTLRCGPAARDLGSAG